MAIALKQRLHWLALHGFVRGGASIGARRGDLQARLIADPTVKAESGAVLRGGAVPRSAGAIPDRLHHRRPCDRTRTAAIRRLPGARRSDRIFPRRCGGSSVVFATICCIRCVRRHCWPWSRRTTPATARRCRRCSPIARCPRCGTGSNRPRSRCWIELSREPGVVDIVDRYCAQLPVAIISDILGVPDNDRQRILEFGELAAPSLDFGLPWPQYRRVQRGIAGFNFWLDSTSGASCAALPATI